MLLDFCEGVSQSLPSVFLPFRNGNTLHRISAVEQTLALRVREDSRERHLYVLVGSVSQLSTVLSSYVLHQVLPIDCPEVTNSNGSDPILDVAVPRILVPLHRTRLESLLNGGKYLFSTKSTMLTPASSVKPTLFSLAITSFLNGMTSDFLG